MKASLFCAITATALVAAVTATEARPPAQLPKITGGGISINDNSEGGCEPALINHMGFNARATGPATMENFPPFNTPAAIYPANGQVNLRTTPADDHGDTLAHVHGEVVCIANLGPAGDVDGVGNCDDGADPDNDVWEVRFQITNVIVGPDLPDNPVYGSLFVQDNGKDDWTDEAFGSLFQADCLLNPFFGLERHIHGNIKVKD